MTAASWLQALLERRRTKHESPWPEEHMAGFRCRVWPLVRQSRLAKRADS
jgi:hypothetical protein